MSATVKTEQTSPERCLNKTLYMAAKKEIEPDSPDKVKTEPAPVATPAFKRLKSGKFREVTLELSSSPSSERFQKRPEPLGRAQTKLM